VVLGEGNQKLTWPRKVIQAVKDSVTSGVKLFNRHNEDNSHTDRSPVGTVVTSFTKEIGGKLRTIAIAAMMKADSLIYDICSIEANIFEENGIVGGVEKVTGIAVSNSKIDNPAFKNAKRMQIVQCFDSQDEPEKPGKETKTVITLEEIMAAPISLIRQAVISREMHPSQLFDESAMQKDNNLSKIFKDRDDLTTVNKELLDKLDTQTKRADSAERKSQVSSATELLKSRMPAGLTDKQKGFIEKKFDPESMENLDEASVDKFIADSKKDFQEYADLFGDKESMNNDENLDDQNDFEPGDTSIDDAFLED